MITAEIVLQLQVTAAGGIELHRLVALFECQATQVGQSGALSILGVLQQCSGSADSQLFGFTAETGQVTGAELGAEQAFGTVVFEMPGWQAFDAVVLQRQPTIFVEQKFSWAQPFEFRMQSFLPAHLLHSETATG